MEDINFSTVQLVAHNFPTIADLRLASGRYENFTGFDIPVTALKKEVATVPYEATFELLVIPHSNIFTNRYLIFTINNINYQWLVEDVIKFEPGKVYTYTITIEKVK